jgi:hypothetical protein
MLSNNLRNRTLGFLVVGFGSAFMYILYEKYVKVKSEETRKH